MPTLSATVNVTDELELAPQLRTRMQNKLQLLAQKLELLEAAKEEVDAVKADLSDLREIAGFKKLEFPGYGTVTLVEGTTSTLDKKKLLAQGVTLAMLENATVVKPKKAYTLCTPAGSKEVVDA